MKKAIVAVLVGFVLMWVIFPLVSMVWSTGKILLALLVLLTIASIVVCVVLSFIQIGKR